MKDTLSFSVPGNDNLHELQVGLTLIRFAEFDLGYFRKQCVGYYRKGTGDSFMDKARSLKEYLRNCHPYCTAHLNKDFDKIALDCVIDDISFREGLSLEELWVRNMKAQDRFGEALFKRITEYKSGNAINEWINLLRMQAYALSKMAFVYGGDAAEPSVHKARKFYFDLVFMKTAAELGFDTGDLPRVKINSIPFLPQSGVLMKNAAFTIDAIVKEATKEIGARTRLKGGECVQDQMAGMALNVMTGMKLPQDDDIAHIIRRYNALPNTVYEPSSFKAVIDLEFDQLIEKGFYLRVDQKPYSRLRYTAKKETVPEAPAPVIKAPKPAMPEKGTAAPADIDLGEGGMKPPATMMKTVAKEKTAAERISLPGAADKLAALSESMGIPQEKKTAAPAASGKERGPASAIAAAAPQDNSGRIRKIIAMAEDPLREPSGKRTLQEVNTRCNMIWTSMNIHTGWSSTAETEVSEWFRYLTQLRYGMGTGELTHAALDKFLDATQEVLRLLPEDGEEQQKTV